MRNTINSPAEDFGTVSQPKDLIEIFFGRPRRTRAAISPLDASNSKLDETKEQTDKECQPSNTRTVADVPDLLKFWDYDRNEIAPDKVCVTSRTVRYWRCQDCDHVWPAKPISRTNSLPICPNCGKCAYGGDQRPSMRS